MLASRLVGCGGFDGKPDIRINLLDRHYRMPQTALTRFDRCRELRPRNWHRSGNGGRASRAR
jgi:hypothetical protein